MRSLLDAEWAAVTAFAPDFIGRHPKSIAGPRMTELVPPAIQPSGLSHRSGQLRCAAVPRAVCIWASSAVSSGAAVRFAPLLPNARGFQHAVRARLLGNQHGRDHREPHEFRRGSAATIPVRDGRRRAASCGHDPQAPLSRGNIHRRRSAVSAVCSCIALTDRLSCRARAMTTYRYLGRYWWRAPPDRIARLPRQCGRCGALALMFAVGEGVHVTSEGGASGLRPLPAAWNVTLDDIMNSRPANGRCYCCRTL
jgi:hypothetical protein